MHFADRLFTISNTKLLSLVPGKEIGSETCLCCIILKQAHCARGVLLRTYELRDEVKKIVNYVWLESASKDYWIQNMLDLAELLNKVN